MLFGPPGSGAEARASGAAGPPPVRAGVGDGGRPPRRPDPHQPQRQPARQPVRGQPITDPCCHPRGGAAGGGPGPRHAQHQGAALHPR